MGISLLQHVLTVSDSHDIVTLQPVTDSGTVNAHEDLQFYEEKQSMHQHKLVHLFDVVLNGQLGSSLETVSIGID